MCTQREPTGRVIIVIVAEREDKREGEEREEREDKREESGEREGERERARKTDREQERQTRRKTPPCVGSKRLRVCVQDAHTEASESTHGGGVPHAKPHHTTQKQHNTTPHTHNHVNTHTHHTNTYTYTYTHAPHIHIHTPPSHHPHTTLTPPSHHTTQCTIDNRP